MTIIARFPANVKRPLLGAILAVSLASAGLHAVAEAPKLTDVQKLQLRNLSLQYEIAEMKAQAVRDELIRSVQALQRDGWTLDLKTLEYAEAAK